MKKIISTVMCFFIALSLSAQIKIKLDLDSLKYPMMVVSKKRFCINREPGGLYNKVYHTLKDNFYMEFPNKNRMVVLGSDGLAEFNIYKKTEELKTNNFHLIAYRAIDGNGEECTFSNVIESGEQSIRVYYKNRALIYE